ncbi:cysteine hydrolase family protein [Aeromicrobium sp. CF4.19]|uniref:cysteine hydrolase family protein n=1 Tax=Aeromicrobium sp. CF4.19 TaxID=3373082 RepID=UPI003EE586BE
MSAWLVVVDPQRIFAAPDSPWGAPRFAEVVDPVRRLAEEHAGRVVVTRWVPPAHKRGSWVDYFEQWPFADLPAQDPLLDVVPELAGLTDRPTIDLPTFGKWPGLEAVTGPTPEIVLAGVSTDCCVLSTALAAADAGATVRVAADACAGSTDEAHEQALAAMSRYAPQITLV